MRRPLTLLILCAAALPAAGCAAATSTSTSAASAVETSAASAQGAPAPAPDAPSAAAAAAGSLSLITEPRAGIAPLLSAARGAKHSVEMVMYEDSDPRVDAALAADEHHGVAVRVLLDAGYYGEGSPQNQTAYDFFKSHGVPVHWTPKYFALTHQKTLIVDGRAYILTFNLTPRYYATSRDFGVIDSNRSDDAAIEKTFDSDWADRRITAPSGADLVWSPGSEAAQVKLIKSARGWMDIYNEEMDSDPIEAALEADARRSVDVRVTMTASSSWGSAFTQLKAAGVHVRTYAANATLYIHAKMILTSAKAFLGSENFSATSMNDNRELGLITARTRIRDSLAATFNSDYAQATPYASSNPGGGSMRAAHCTVAASYNSRYDDFDVDVSSDQPDATATATDSSGTTASYHTNSSGYADIYLKAPSSAAGEKVTVHVGAATCVGTL